jgi:uncharacterized protein (TIRG00374 family)
MASGLGEAPRRRVPSWLLPAFGYGLSAASLIWVYWGFEWKTQLPKLAAVHWRWVSLAIVADIGTFLFEGWRWTLLLSPIAPARFLRSTQAIFVGLFTNSILPFRTGELVRTYLQSRWLEIPYSVCLSSVILERILDGILLVLGFYAVTFFVEVPGFLRDGSLAMAAGLGVLSVLLAIVIIHKRHAHAAVSRSRWAAMLWHVVEGLHAMGRSPSFLGAAAISLLYLAAQLLPIYAIVRGLELNVPLGAVAVVLLVLRIGTTLPQAPGNVGGFQFFVVLALQLFDVDKGEAAGFATLLFLVVTVPLLVGGAIASALTGIRIRDLQHHARGGFPRSV